ncbi:MAG: GlsB/YeaQ/YmgE family stress response membrane protein [Candidatus Promineifilaceae bacterium]|nr:GlsB/YeaQ/YmgE family stress response membrane protein [Candidatus Promineifilaceae bacterium]
MLWNIIAWLIIGGLAGWIASMVMDTDASMGALANIIVGILGAIIGGFLVGLFGVEVATFSIAGLIVAILGAIVLLAIVNAVAT